jgi:hypothetical protein
LEDKLAGEEVGGRVRAGEGSGGRVRADEESGGRVRVRHNGPVTQRSLEALAIDGGVRVGWGDYRLEVLAWLEGHGVGGVGELMFCTMKQLMGSRRSV